MADSDRQSMLRQARDILIELYGEVEGQKTVDHLLKRLDKMQGGEQKTTNRRGHLNHQDAILITYGDMVQEAEKPGLASLAEFCRVRLKGLVKGVHVLPFYPYSSDDGFSIIDYKAVDPALGTWGDITTIAR